MTDNFELWQEFFALALVIWIVASIFLVIKEDSTPVAVGFLQTLGILFCLTIFGLLSAKASVFVTGEPISVWERFQVETFGRCLSEAKGRRPASSKKDDSFQPSQSNQPEDNTPNHGLDLQVQEEPVLPGNDGPVPPP